MTTITEQGHQLFKALSNSSAFRKHVKSNQDEVIKGACLSVFLAPSEPQLTFVKRVVQLHKKYYLYCDSGNFFYSLKILKEWLNLTSGSLISNLNNILRVIGWSK